MNNVCALLLLAYGVIQPVLTLQWPYLQTYPPVNSRDWRIPLYIAAVFSTSGPFPTMSVIPGIQIALDYINNEPSILPGYSLHYTLTDSKCQSLGAVNSFFRQIFTEPTKLAWIGSGCSVATKSTAELTPFYNLTQVSCVSVLTENDRHLRRYYFQALPSTDIAAYGYLSLVLNFKWKKVSIITQNDNAYISLMKTLKEGLEFYGIQYTETIFTDVKDVGEATYNSSERIFIWVVDTAHARELACQAYQHGLKYPKYQFLLPGWFPDGWLNDLPFTKLDCSETERARTLEYSLTVRLHDFDNASNDTGIGGYSLEDFQREVEDRYGDPINSFLNISRTAHSSPELCYEATLSIAFALHNTLMDIKSDINLSQEAAREAGLTEGDMFSLANFSYANSAIVERMFHYLSSTNFRGINARPVDFNKNGRVTRTLNMGQYIINDNRVIHIEIGVVKNASIEGSFLQISDAEKLWPDGTPTDGLPIINIATVYTSNVVVFSLLGVIGIIYSLAYMIFNYAHRNKKIIRLSSPNLNYIMALGAILLYSSLFFLMVRGVEDSALLTLYHMSTWILNLGYTLFFGTISSKMIRIWYIFKNPTPQKKLTIKDHHLFWVVMAFVAVDVIILGSFTLIEGVRGNLKLHLVRSAEEPRELIGPTAEVHEYFFYGTFESTILAWYGVLTIEKEVLGLIALFLAFCTRKVKTRGLDDSKFVICATYVMNIFSLTGMAATISAYSGYFNVFIAILGTDLFISTTTVLSLVFIPKIIALYKDPTGNNIGAIVVAKTSIANVIDPGSTICDRLSEIKTLRKQIHRLESKLLQLKEDSGVGLEDITEVSEHEHDSENTCI